MSYLGVLPTSLVLLAIVTFGISYIIAVVRGDVQSAFPYISDTGSKKPESCIFGQLLNFVAFLAFWTMYIRYKIVQAISQSTLSNDWKLSWLNKIAFSLGIVSALGTSIVANFQEGSIVEPVHETGAVMAFVIGVIYCFLQTALSYHMCPDYNGHRICRIRLSISLIAGSSLVVTVVAGVFAFMAWKSKSPSYSKFKWSADDPGYAAHIISTAGEWVTALTFLFFFFTYTTEFDKFEMEIRARPLVAHLDQVPESRLKNEVNERSHLLV